MDILFVILSAVCHIYSENEIKLSSSYGLSLKQIHILFLKIVFHQISVITGKSTIYYTGSPCWKKQQNPAQNTIEHVMI